MSVDHNCVEVSWRKSSQSSQGNCVEVSQGHALGVLVRNSRDPEGSILSFTPSEWRAFVEGVKLGEFDEVATLE